MKRDHALKKNHFSAAAFFCLRTVREAFAADVFVWAMAFSSAPVIELDVGSCVSENLLKKHLGYEYELGTQSDAQVPNNVPKRSILIGSSGESLPSRPVAFQLSDTLKKFMAPTHQDMFVLSLAQVCMSILRV